MSKSAIITGSTRGIGRCTAVELAKAGYRVMVNGTNRALIDEVVGEIRHHGGTATGYCADVTDDTVVEAMVSTAVAEFGRIDVLIHNAGNLQDRKCLRMMKEDWLAVADVHLNGAFNCIRSALPHMTAHGGDIILMTSTAGLSGSAGQVNYSAAKAGILGIVWTLAEELKRYRIRVNAVAPAALTDMTRPVIERLERMCAERNEPFPEFWRVGEAEDVARFISVMLARPENHLSGEIFGVNGSRITRWRKPAPDFSADDVETFFELWTREIEGKSTHA
ncbi:SDR family NAD(P)-dependent oxidoreductase [Paenibacillus sp. DYY-L-2]|uniref:SDR family NAD(P)-dependent oxidoreductase n=1 Tax=Paenibacillus sp. DYY-L-2 TaxID=3447013 RepID=UPI003F4FFB8F